MNEPNSLALNFADALRLAHKERRQRLSLKATAEKLHVATTGAGFTELYETLRNASENTEENLLLIRAIRRFYKRAYLIPETNLKNIGEDLITELTLAGYLKNDSVPLSTAQEITQITQKFSSARKKLLAKFPQETTDRWTIDPMSAAIEKTLRDYSLNEAFTDLAYNYFLNAINVEKLFPDKHPPSYEATLLVAVQHTLLKTDVAAIRLELIERYQISTSRTVDFAKFNVQLDQIFASETLDKLNHIINRLGAPFRILLRAMDSDEKLAEHLSSEKALLGPFNAAINESYTGIRKNINRGIVRSVIFLIITKFIIGIAAEVPYDIWIHGGIKWTALIVNLALPPLYMIALRLTLVMPDTRNTRALNREISRILFAPIPSRPFIGNEKSHHFSRIYNFIYSLMIISVFVGIGWILSYFAGFEWIHLLIFFFFISAASFLGFRISRSIREIEVGDETQNSVTMIRDLLYMPFVAIGRHISETYSKLNIISRFLDMFVELPLKTLLSFLRRWGNFLSAKKDSF